LTLPAREAGGSSVAHGVSRGYRSVREASRDSGETRSGSVPPRCGSGWFFHAIPWLTPWATDLTPLRGCRLQLNERILINSSVSTFRQSLRRPPRSPDQGK